MRLIHNDLFVNYIANQYNHSLNLIPMEPIEKSMLQKHRPAVRTWMVVLMMINLATFLIAAGSNLARAQSADEVAIKKLLKAAPAAFYKRNMEAYKAAWKHAPESSITRVSSMSYNSTKGWNKVQEAAVKTFKDNPELLSINIDQENFIIRVDGKLATAEYDQTLSNFPDDPETKFRSHQYSILEKESNQWKVVTHISHNPESFANTDAAIEARLNASGYSLLSAEKIDEAIDVFKLNVQLYPKAWNTYDSLGEAYALKGNKELAIKNYEKSMELNPNNEFGKLALVKLKE
jgi:tetratricopeptide (TPR) repeat protein